MLGVDLSQMEFARIYMLHRSPESLNDRVGQMTCKGAGSYNEWDEFRGDRADLYSIAERTFFQDQLRYHSDPAAQTDHGQQGLVTGYLGVNIGLDIFLLQPTVNANTAESLFGHDDRSTGPIRNNFV